MQDDIPVLDRNQVNELIGNNQDIIKQVFAISFDILPGRMNALEDAILSGDCDDVYRVFHAMYGTISTIGGMRVSAMAKEMEKPQYSDPTYFGHKKPPKKRPVGKKKFCKECGMSH